MAMPLDLLKIDKSFIRDAPNDAYGVAIVAIVPSLAKNWPTRSGSSWTPDTKGKCSLFVQH